MKMSGSGKNQYAYYTLIVCVRSPGWGLHTFVAPNVSVNLTIAALKVLFRT